MSIFQNQEYLNFLTRTQRTKIILDNVLEKKEKRERFEFLLKVYFYNKLTTLQDIEIKPEDISLSYSLKNVSDINKDYISKITNNQFYYKESNKFFDLNILNNVPDLNLFFICEISISDKIPNKSLRRASFSNTFGLFYSENNYKGYYIVQLSEVNDLLYLLRKSFYNRKICG